MTEERILNAALNGPEVKLVNIKGHEFNVKPISYRIHNDEVTIFGQLSHCLRFRTDDQVWYSFKKKGNKIIPADPEKMVVEKEDGGLLKTIGKLKDVGGFIGGFFGIGANKFFDLLENQSGNLDFIDFDGDWEGAAKSFFSDLAKQTVPPKSIKVTGLMLFQDDNLRGNSINIKVGDNVENAKTIGWNDRASSLLAVVPEGKKLELYQHDNFHGLVLELGPGSHIVRDLKIHRLGDEITSVRWENV